MDELQTKIDEEFKKIVGVLPKNCKANHLDPFRERKIIDDKFYIGSTVNFRSGKTCISI